MRERDRRINAALNWLDDEHAGDTDAAGAFGIICDLRDALQKSDTEVKDTLKAVLHHFGPGGANTICREVLAMRAARALTPALQEKE